MIADRLNKVAGRAGDRDPHRLPHLLPARPGSRVLPRDLDSELTRVGSACAGLAAARLAVIQDSSAPSGAPESSESAARGSAAASWSLDRRPVRRRRSATSAAAALSSDRVAHRARSRRPAPPGHRGVVRAVAAAQRSGRRPRDPELGRVEPVLARPAPSATTQTRDVVVVVSSSRPSSPRNTRAERPRPASTSAITGAIRSSATPIADADGRAGLVSGPRKLNTVGTPSSLRAAAAWRIAGWKTGAKQKPMPTSMQRGHRRRRQVDHDARAPRARRPSRRPRTGRPVAVLDDPGARAAHHQRRHRRDVHRGCPVTAGPADVHRRAVDAQQLRVRPASPGPGRRSPPASRPWPAAPRRSRPAAPAWRHRS